MPLFEGDARQYPCRIDHCLTDRLPVEGKQGEANRALPMEDLMKLMIICILGAVVFAAPCIYDISSQEPSPLVGLLTVASAAPF